MAIRLAIGSHSKQTTPYLNLSLWLIILPGLLGSAKAQDGSAQQDGSLKPVTVCEVLSDPKHYEGHPVALLGRYSFREQGRWIGEDHCTNGGDEKNNSAASGVVWLAYSPSLAPRLNGDFALDGAVVADKLEAMKKHTSLKQFRFGSSDYDRWAVVYGEFKIEENGSPAAD